MSAGAASERETTAKRDERIDDCGRREAARHLGSGAAPAARRAGRGCLQLLVRAGRSGGAERRRRPPVGADGLPEGLDQVALRRPAARALARRRTRASAASTCCAARRCGSSPTSRSPRTRRKAVAGAGRRASRRPLRRLAARPAADLRDLLRGPLERRRLPRRARRGGRAGGKRAGLQPALHPCRRRARQDASPAGDRARGARARSEPPRPLSDGRALHGAVRRRRCATARRSTSRSGCARSTSC